MNLKNLESKIGKTLKTALSLVVGVSAYGTLSQDVQAQKYDFTPNPGVTIEDGYHPLPSTEGWRFLGERMEDRIKSIPGKESLMKGYQKGNVQLLITSLKGKPSGFWYFDTKTKQTFNGRADYEGDANFEQNTGSGGKPKVNFSAYGVK